MAIPKAKRILIAPLDWGLGHTARCVPIIRHIQRLGHVPIVAGNNRQRLFIEKTFEDIDFIHLDGYNVTYTAAGSFIRAGILAQLPRLVRRIGTEHIWLQQQARELCIDGIISDNRYGLHHAHIPAVILTHQLQIPTGMGKLTDYAVRKIHYKYLSHFGAAWVADQPGMPNLSGRLAHPPVLPVGVKYIGWLSQFEEYKPASITDGSLLILLSGPEPQRSILSGILWQQALHYEGKIVFVEGSEAVNPPSFIPPHIIYHKQVTRNVLAPLLHAAGMVICRSGYSTIMDLVALRKKAILIPTRGQTEQEYLGRYLKENGMFYTVLQKGFDLGTALAEAKNFPYGMPEIADGFSGYKQVIAEWIETL